MNSYRMNFLTISYRYKNLNANDDDVYHETPNSEEQQLFRKNDDYLNPLKISKFKSRFEQ